MSDEISEAAAAAVVPQSLLASRYLAVDWGFVGDDETPGRYLLQLADWWGFEMSGVDLIRAERKRQRSRATAGEAYSLGHDDSWENDELARVAAVYAMPERYRKNYGAPLLSQLWNWRLKPTPDDRIRELVKAGALIAAEIDRLTRVASGGGS